MVAQNVSRKAARVPAFQSQRPKPFTPARRVFAKVAQAEPVADDDLSALMEGEEDEDEEVDVSGEFDADILAAVAVATELVSTFDDELLHEVDMVDAESKASVEQMAEDAMDRVLSSGTATEALLAGLAGDDVPEAENVEDAQGPHGFRKYDEQVDAGMSVEQREAVAKYKLTKNELANLVPKDWDTINIDWFSSRREDNIALPEYKLSFLWQEKNIAVGVDQVYSRGQVSPLTEFFFWPRKDAWEELKAALEARPWIAERDKVILLNRLTEVINFWQDEATKHSIDEARSSFPDCGFAGI